MPHKTEPHPDVVQHILKRRGKMHVHDTIDPRRTALVSIDMQVGFLAGQVLNVSKRVGPWFYLSKLLN